MLTLQNFGNLAAQIRPVGLLHARQFIIVKAHRLHAQRGKAAENKLQRLRRNARPAAHLHHQSQTMLLNQSRILRAEANAQRR